MLTFLGYIVDFLEEVFTYNVINGITIGTILLYNMLLVTLFVALTRR